MSWITDPFWITESVDKLWRATRDGLTLSCTVHHDAPGDAADFEEEELSVEPAGMTRSFN